jgi:hypothetical protein
MLEQIKEDASIAKFDLTDPQPKFLRNFKESSMKTKADNTQKMALPNSASHWKQDDVQ